MGTPSEVQLKKCHDCEVAKPLSEFVKFAFGKRAGRYGVACATCWGKSLYVPSRCTVCAELRPHSEFDKKAEGGAICKACLVAAPENYTKECSQCHEVRPLLTFHKQSRTHYRVPVCDGCSGENEQRKHKTNRAAILLYSRDRTQRIRMEAYKAYGGAKCACCGTVELPFLTLDHIDNDGAAWRREVFGCKGNQGSGTRTYDWCKKNGYPPIFQVLCWNCQNGKRFNGGVCPHQLETCRGHSLTEVGSSDPKRSEPQAGYDMVQSPEKFGADLAALEAALVAFGSSEPSGMMN